MNKVLLACGLGLVLAGCNATVRPVIDLETRSRVITPSYSTYYQPIPEPRPMFHHQRRCAVVWDRTPRGYVERQVCGNHIP